MNTNQITVKSKTEPSVPNLYSEESQHATIIGSANKAEDATIIHDAKIIMPQPYGVFALCKIMEHFQTN